LSVVCVVLCCVVLPSGRAVWGGRSEAGQHIATWKFKQL